MDSAEIAKSGLEGVVAGDTAICCVEQGTLLYRGYAIGDLAGKACFEEVAYLLLYGELPKPAELARMRKTLDGFRGLPPAVVQAIRAIPNSVPMMDVLRTSVSMAGHFDPVQGESPTDQQKRSLWLLAVVADIVATRFRLKGGKEPVAAKPGLPHAAQILYMGHGIEPDATATRLLDLTLVLYAEHEFNASTFTDRVIASTESDLVSAIVGAIGALKGPLHGGANEQSMQLIARFKSAGDASAWVKDALARKEKVMGFGHRVYKNGDHRAHILEAEMRKLAQQKKREDLVAIYDAIKVPIVSKAKPIYPNVDFPCGLTYFLLDLPLDLYTPLFVCSRVSGWCAHYIEQREHNRLYRPLSRYNGPQPRTAVPIEKR